MPNIYRFLNNLHVRSSGYLSASLSSAIHAPLLEMGVHGQLSTTFAICSLYKLNSNKLVVWEPRFKHWTLQYVDH